jgi:hypothetical protein
MTDSSPPLAENCRLVAHLDLAGAGQVTVDGDTCYVGHLPSAGGLGTTILDISDPRRPEVLATIDVGDKDSHSHKVRVAGDVMIVNHERNNTGIGRKAEQLPPARARLTETLGRAPSHAELAAAIGVGESDIPLLEETARSRPPEPRRPARSRPPRASRAARTRHRGGSARWARTRVRTRYRRARARRP